MNTKMKNLSIENFNAGVEFIFNNSKEEMQIINFLVENGLDCNVVKTPNSFRKREDVTTTNSEEKLAEKYHNYLEENKILPYDLFHNNQILTLEIAKRLIGKTIAVTNPEDRANKPYTRIGTILAIESEWDLAGKEDHSHLDGGKYATRQDYWKSYMGELAIEDKKNRMKIVSEYALYCTCDLQDKWTFKEPTFFGSDSDREIYYKIID